MHEIIHVVDAESFSDAPAHGLEIEAVDGRPLPAGYYFVLWPTRKAAAKKRGKRYFGPLHTPGEARLLMTTALLLGLAEDAQPRPAIAECRSIARQDLAANDGCAPRSARRHAIRAGW